MVEPFPSWAGFHIEPYSKQVYVEMGEVSVQKYRIFVDDGYSGNDIDVICIDSDEEPMVYREIGTVTEVGWDTNGDGQIDSPLYLSALAKRGWGVIRPNMGKDLLFKVEFRTLSPPDWIDPFEYYYACIRLVPSPPDGPLDPPWPPGYCKSGPMAFVQLQYEWNTSGPMLVVFGNNVRFPDSVPVNCTPDLMPPPSRCILRNMGNAQLTINGIIDADPFFVTTSQPLPVVLQQGETLDVDVEFKPSAPGTWINQPLLIDCDPPNGDNQIFCSGSARWPEIGLECSPRIVDFGTITESGRRPTPRVRSVAVSNLSEDDLEIECQIHDSAGVSSDFTWLPSGNLYEITNGTLTASIPYTPPLFIRKRGLNLKIQFSPTTPGEYGVDDDVRIVINGKLAQTPHITIVDESVKVRGIWNKVKPLLWLRVRQKYTGAGLGALPFPTDKFPFEGVVFADQRVRASVNLSYEIKPIKSHIVGDPTVVKKDIGKVDPPYPKPFTFDIEIPSQIKARYPSMVWDCTVNAETKGPAPKTSATFNFRVYITKD